MTDSVEAIAMISEEMMRLLQDPELAAAFQMAYIEKLKKETVNKYKMLNAHTVKGAVLCVGSSLMEWFPINEMRQSFGIVPEIYNRGIAGATTDDLLSVMDACIFELAPSKIFINIGSNDIAAEGYQQEKLLANYQKILQQIKEVLPSCTVYVMAYYPINADDDFGMAPDVHAKQFKTRTNANIVEANEAIAKLAKTFGFYFINVNDGLTDENGNLKAPFSIEGYHLWPDAYAIILENLKPYL
jgi:lysophospholipase L1-like esterase